MEAGKFAWVTSIVNGIFGAAVVGGGVVVGGGAVVVGGGAVVVGGGVVVVGAGVVVVGAGVVVGGGVVPPPQATNNPEDASVLKNTRRVAFFRMPANYPLCP